MNRRLPHHTNALRDRLLLSIPRPLLGSSEHVILELRPQDFLHHDLLLHHLSHDESLRPDA